MNMYRFEIAKRIKTMIIMPLCIGLLTFAGMGKFEGLQSSMNAKDLYAAFPRPIQIIFGINDLDLTTLAGYMGTIFLYVMLILGIYAAYLGVDGAIGEKLNKQIDFVFALPVSRKQLFISKVFGHMTVIVIITLLSTLGIILALLPFKGNESIDFLISFQLSLLLIQLFFYTLGSGIGMLLKERVAVSIATGSVVLFYFFGVVFRFFEWSGVYLLSPFTSLSAVELLGKNSLIPAVVLYSILTIGMLVASMIWRMKSDM